MSYSLAITQAVAVMVYISVKVSNGHLEYLSTKHISQKLNIPAPSVTKILKHLNSSGLLITKEGAGGGMLLSKNPTDISLLDIFLAMENKSNLFKKISISLEDEKAKILEGNIHAALDLAEETMKKTLSNTTLSDLIKEK